MREKDRIERIIYLISEIWKKNQDVRFNQLIRSLQIEYENGKYVKTACVDVPGWGTEDVSYPDLFYVEDDKFEVFLINKNNNL